MHYGPGIPYDHLLYCYYDYGYEDSGGGFSKDFSKLMTILANEVIIAGTIGPAINIWLAR